MLVIEDNIDPNISVFDGSENSLLGVILGLLSISKKYGKGSANIIRDLIQYSLLLLPKENAFPKTLSELTMVKLYLLY